MSEKILIVDDDVDSLKLIGLMLQRHGYDVIAANAGHQAITKALNEIPDLIILDVMMPDMNGYEVCRRLRDDDSTRAIPIIMFTAKTLLDDKVAGFEAGADDYLTKPTHPAELAARVKTILDRNGNAGTTKPQSSTGVIGVLGTKGGLGTTTVALNIAAAMLSGEQKPIVADFRPGSGSMGLYLGAPRSKSISIALGKPTAEITPALLKDLIYTHQTGLRALLSSTHPMETLVRYAPETTAAVVKTLRHLGNPTVLDLGSGYSPLIHAVRDQLEKLIILVDPNKALLPLTRDLLKEVTARKAIPVYIVVVNRVQHDLQPSWHEIETTLDREISATIDADAPLTYQAIEAGMPVVKFKPDSIISSQLRKLAEDTLRIPANGR